MTRGTNKTTRDANFMNDDIKRISPAELKAALHDGQEIALLDAREEGVFNDRHILLAACAPLSRLELVIDDIVPRRAARTVWCDDGEGLGEQAALRMAALGYTDVALLDGGTPAWEAAGYTVYEGVHVPSKAFAEVVEHEAATPHISAEELKAMIDGGDDIGLFDTRTYAEFHANSIPTAVSAPGAEIVYRFKDLVPSEDTLVVVNCGGRTRSIIGAQALINAGVPNKVVSLKNGTQDWHLAGYEIVEGATRRAPDPSPEALAAAKAYGDRVGSLSGIQEIDAATLAAWRAEADQRTLYLIDVRTSEEYAAGHAPGARNVAGGQLVQETDGHMAVWGARAVLFDDDGVRAQITASWLKQMGWDVAVMRNDAVGAVLETGPHRPAVLGLNDAKPATVAPADLQSMLQRDAATVIDLALSKAYKAGHIPGAWFAIRSRLGDDLGKVGSPDRLIFTSPDGALARLAAAEYADAAPEVAVLDGGTDAWRAAGLPLTEGFEAMASTPEDLRLAAREQPPEQMAAAMHHYLAWEIELVNQMAKDDDHRFDVHVPS